MYEDRMWNVMMHTERFENGIGEQNVLFHSIGRASQLGEVGQALLGALGLTSARLAGDQDGLRAIHASLSTCDHLSFTRRARQAKWCGMHGT
jgi:hypothetical protein